MDDNLKKVIDKAFLSALLELVTSLDKSGLDLLPFLVTNCAKHDMPVNRIPDFLLDFSRYIDEKTQEQKQAQQDKQDLQDLLSNSGLMMIGFTPDQKEGDDQNGNG